MFKNIQTSEIFEFQKMITYQEHQVLSRTIVQNKALSMTIFSFDQNEGLTPHTSKGDAMVTILDGKAEITIDGKVYHLTVGQSIIMPRNIVHALHATERFKMLLVVVFE